MFKIFVIMLQVAEVRPCFKIMSSYLKTVERFMTGFCVKSYHLLFFFFLYHRECNTSKTCSLYIEILQPEMC